MRKPGIALCCLVVGVGLWQFGAGAEVFRAASYYQMGDYARALELYDRKLASDPTNSDWHYNRGVILSQTSPRQAMEAFKQAIQLNPRMVRAEFGRTLTSLELGDVTLAVQSADSLGRMASNAAERGLSHLARGVVWLADQKPVNAFREFERALAEAPASDGTGLIQPDKVAPGPVSCASVLLRSMTLRWLDQPNSASRDARAASRCNPRHEIVQLNLALALEAVADKEAATTRKNYESSTPQSRREHLTRLSIAQLALEFLRSHNAPGTATFVDIAAAQTSAAAALLVVLLLGLPGRDRILVPFIRGSDGAERAELTPWSNLALQFPFLRWHNFYKFSLPLFTSMYVVAILAFVVAFIPEKMARPGGIFFVSGLWMVTLALGYPGQTVLLLAVPGAATWFLTGSAYWCLLVVGMLAGVFYAFAYRDTLVFETAMNRRTVVTGRTLHGQVGSVARRVAGWATMFPLATAVSALIAVARQSEAGKLDFLLRWFDADSAWLTLPVLLFAYTYPGLGLVKSMHTARQTDWLASLATPSSSGADSIAMPSGNRLFLSFAFITLDFWLTALTVTGQSPIPGVGAGDVATICALIKLPRALVALEVVLGSRGRTRVARLVADAERLVRDLQESLVVDLAQIRRSEFIRAIGGNRDA